MYVFIAVQLRLICAAC